VDSVNIASYIEKELWLMGVTANTGRRIGRASRRPLRRKKYMVKTANMHIRIDRKVKADADRLFQEMGLTLSSGVSLYLRKVVHTGRIPFDLSVPDKESLRVLAKAKAGQGLHEAANADELFRELNK